MKLKPIFLSLSRFLARQAIQEGVRRALPAVYRKLDQVIPNALLEGFTPKGIEDVISTAIIQATGLKPTADDVKGVAVLYDPIAAAIPLARRLLR